MTRENIPGLDKRAPLKVPGVSDVHATRPDIPGACAGCTAVVYAVQEAVQDRPDATEIHANCTPFESSVEAGVRMVVQSGSEAGSEELPVRNIVCVYARDRIMGSGH